MYLRFQIGLLVKKERLNIINRTCIIKNISKKNQHIFNTYFQKSIHQLNLYYK